MMPRRSMEWLAVGWAVLMTCLYLLHMAESAQHELSWRRGRLPADRAPEASP
jgi:hypothetical protein